MDGAALASNLVTTVQICSSCCLAHIIVTFFQLQDAKFQQFVLLPQVLRLRLQLRYPIRQHCSTTWGISCAVRQMFLILIY